jgi:ketosteroid isomerase-like protein
MTDEELAQILEVANRPEVEVASLEDRIRRLEDRNTIHDLVMRYGWLCDARRWDELLDLYTDDFERILSGTLQERASGKAAMRALYEAPVLPRADGDGGPPAAAAINQYEIRHMIQPPVIRIDESGDGATAVVSYAIVATVGDGPDFRRGVHEGGYVFGFRREAAGWRFCTMTVISENARNPLFQG